MCIIAAKPAGVPMPLAEYIQNMWTGNPDGAGLMYAINGKVTIEKGFMLFEQFKARLKQLENEIDIVKTPLVMHFRIGTHGGNIPANTHPFPITDSIPMLQKLKVTTSIGVAHNGIIPVTPRQKDISDTMEFIASQLAPLSRYEPKFYKSKDLMLMIGNAAQSKLAFLTGKGDIYTIGNFVEEDGILYSNSSYAWTGYYRRGVIKEFPAYLEGYDEDDNGERSSFLRAHEDTLSVRLMQCPEGSYMVSFDTGGYYDCFDYDLFIDQTGHAYFYDIFADKAYPVADAGHIYTQNGMDLQYNPDEAFQTPVDMIESIWLDELSNDDDERGNADV